MKIKNYSFTDRKKIIEGYEEWIALLRTDRTKRIYFVNFMFKHIYGSETERLLLMKSDVTQFHAQLKHHIVRKPNSPGWDLLQPRLIGAPDLPVFKSNVKTPLSDFRVNNGLHFNAVLAAPIPRREELVGQVKQSRLTVGLIRHINANIDKYLTPRLERIFIERIRYDTMIDYTFKWFKRGRFDESDILTL